MRTSGLWLGLVENTLAYRIKQEKIKFTEIKMKNQKLTLYFSTAKECTMFGLKYDREKQKEIFRTKEWS
jgi:hypothetical protein